MRRERLHQPVELLQPVAARREARRELHEVAAEPARLGERRGFLDQPPGHRQLQLGREAHPAALVGLGLVAQVGWERVEHRRVA